MRLLKPLLSSATSTPGLWNIRGDSPDRGTSFAAAMMQILKKNTRCAMKVDVILSSAHDLDRRGIHIVGHWD